MKDAVLLLSSGLDSAANLALSPAFGFHVRAALTIDYGQRGATREVAQAKKLAEHFGIDHLVFDLRSFSLLAGKGSALLGGQDVPVPSSLDDLGVATQTAAAVWVPNRNGVMLSLAAAMAEARGLGAVAVGFNAEEAVTFPDNTVDYMRSVTASLVFSTANKVEVMSATATLTKPQIVARLAEADFPFELLWSCYHAGTKHCAQCESCQRLKRAVATGLTPELSARILERLF
jgi:7-cyano-7-deazaguanine synthase